MTTYEVPPGCPAHVPADRYRVFDYTRDPLDAVSPFEGYLKLRGEPHFWSPVAGGFWVLTDGAAIRECFQDAATFSNRNIGLGYTKHTRTMIPEQLDPPEHGKYRRILSPYFTPTTARRLEAEMRAVCNQAIDAFIADSECDMVEQFTGVYPQIVFLRHVLNLPVEHMETFLAWEHDVMHHPIDPEQAARSSQAVIDYLTDVVARRARDPLPEDLLSELLAAPIDDRKMTEQEVVDIAFLLFAAGLDTVTSALSFSFHYLARNADKRRQIIDDASVIPSAIEELLRYHSFVSSVRTATRDVEFHGITIKEGERVLPVSVLAARDPAEFPDPDEMRFDRPANRHIAFGTGPHRCLGSHLARLEMKVALEEWHRRIPEYSLREGVPIAFHAAGTLGMNNLPLGWNEAVQSG